MKIGDIDKNLAVNTDIPFDDIVWLDSKDAPIRIHGLAVHEHGKSFLRMPQNVADKVSGGVASLNGHTAGGRIRFATDSPYIAIRAVMPDNGTMPHITMLGQSGFDLYVTVDGKESYSGSFMPANRKHGYSSWKPTDSKMHTYTINMPLYDPVEEVYIGLASSANIAEPEDYKYTCPVVYYGSSITQGGCASRPGNSYQALITRMLSCDHINLGFSGNAHGEPVIAKYIASLEQSVFVCDYDHNSVNPQELWERHYPLYETFRKAQPKTPVIFVTRPDFHPDNNDEVERRKAVIATYERAKANGDENVYFIDGATIFDGEFRDSCTVDGCHPNDLGFSRMALVIGKAVEKALTSKE